MIRKSRLVRDGIFADIAQCKGSLRDFLGPPCYDFDEVKAMRDIGKNIKHFRIKRNLTQDQLAEQLFVTRQTVSNYETGKSRPDIDMLVKISQVLGIDIHQVIYGPEAQTLKLEVIRLIVGAGIIALLGILWAVLVPIAQVLSRTQYDASLGEVIYFVIKPLMCLTAGWTLAQLVGMALRKKPLDQKWARRVGAVLLVLVIICAMLMAWWIGAVMLNNWQYRNFIRGEWVETQTEVNGEKQMTKGWSNLPPQVPQWLAWFMGKITYAMIFYPVLFEAGTFLTGAALWLFGFPWRIKRKENIPPS